MLEIVVNPVGASGKCRKLWEKTEPLFRASGKPYRVHYSTRERGIADICAELTSQGNDVDLIIVGGDGSLNEAVNGIRDFAHTRFGFIPCGSGNDFAHSVNLPKDRKKTVEMILEGKVRREVNVGEVVFHNESSFLDIPNRRIVEGRQECERVRRFNNGAGIGFDAQICEEVALSPLKDILNKIGLGKLCYTIMAIRLIFTMKMLPLRMTYNGKTISFSRTMLTVGMNHLYEGGGFMFAPAADPTDDLIDICVGDQLSRFDFFRILPYAFSGKHVKFKGIHLDKTKEVRICTEEPAWVQTDGEVTCMSSDITLRLHSEKMKMLV